MEKEFEEIKKSGNFRQPKPYMGNEELWSKLRYLDLDLDYSYLKLIEVID